MIDEFTGIIHDEISWCMLFTDDIVLVGESRADVNAKLELWRLRILRLDYIGKNIVYEVQIQ